MKYSAHSVPFSSKATRSWYAQVSRQLGVRPSTVNIAPWVWMASVGVALRRGNDMVTEIAIFD